MPYLINNLVLVFYYPINKMKSIQIKKLIYPIALFGICSLFLSTAPTEALTSSSVSSTTIAALNENNAYAIPTSTLQLFYTNIGQVEGTAFPTTTLSSSPTANGNTSISLTFPETPSSPLLPITPHLPNTPDCPDSPFLPTSPVYPSVPLLPTPIATATFPIFPVYPTYGSLPTSTCPMSAGIVSGTSTGTTTSGGTGGGISTGTSTATSTNSGGSTGTTTATSTIPGGGTGNGTSTGTTTTSGGGSSSTGTTTATTTDSDVFGSGGGGGFSNGGGAATGGSGGSGFMNPGTTGPTNISSGGGSSIGAPQVLGVFAEADPGVVAGETSPGLPSTGYGDSWIAIFYTVLSFITIITSGSYLKRYSR